MGQCASALADAGRAGRAEYLSNKVMDLEKEVATLREQLRVSGTPSTIQTAQQPVHAAPPAATPGKPHLEVLWFPDPGMPCKFIIDGQQCRRGNACTFSHQATSLVRLLQWINNAKATLDICVFTITCDELANAVISAHRRGVRVRVLTDNDQANNQGSDIARMAEAGIPCRTDKDQFHMHHKFCVIDSQILINGSFNWTRQAVLNNQENVVICVWPELAKSFTAHYEQMWAKFGGA